MTNLNDLQKRLQLLKEKLALEDLKKEIRQLQAQSAKPDFWQDQQKATRQMKKLSQLEKEIETLNQIEKDLAAGQTKPAEKDLDQLELKVFLSGQYDASPALLSIHAGQGGVEAMDWAQMLQRMYLKYFEKKDWPSQVVSESPGEEAGIKSVTLSIDQPYAYGYLKFEAGTHRLVRQSPFNADNLRQTSFALVEVLPQIEEEEIKINEDDLDWQFFRASTQGGQNVQKVSSAVRLIHRPTNLVVTCEQERSQEQNRKTALQLLQAKLWQKEEEEKAAEVKKLKGGRTQAAWGTQIRSYVLHPYKMVKDLRTQVETPNAQEVLDGNLDLFLQAEVRRLSNPS